MVIKQNPDERQLAEIRGGPYRQLRVGQALTIQDPTAPSLTPATTHPKPKPPPQPQQQPPQLHQTQAQRQQGKQQPPVKATPDVKTKAKPPQPPPSDSSDDGEYPPPEPDDTGLWQARANTHRPNRGQGVQEPEPPQTRSNSEAHTSSGRHDANRRTWRTARTPPRMPGHHGVRADNPPPTLPATLEEAPPLGGKPRSRGADPQQ